MMILEKPNTTSPVSEENPPPYNRTFYPTDFGPSGSSSVSIRDLPLPPLPQPLPPPLPEPDHIKPVKEVFLCTTYKNITGTFCIDPGFPGTATEIRPRRKTKRPNPNASIQTNHGTVSLNLASSGRPTESASKTDIQVSTRTGDINLVIFHVPSQRHMNLEAQSRRGNVALLVPQTFCGVIQLSTKRGSLKFLPSFAKSMRVLKSNDYEALVLIGETNFSKGVLPHSGAADYCHLTSRLGKVIVGLAGEDTYESEPGFWKRMGEKLLGRKMDLNCDLGPRGSGHLSGCRSN